jgi:transmembrane sensor
VKLSHHVDLEKALLWRDGHLVFDNEPLGRVVARMNDYGGDPIVVSDPAVAGLRISGIFQAGHDEAFLKALTSYYGLAVTRRGHAVVIASANSRS